MSMKAGNIFVPTFGISVIILFMIFFVWKRFSRSLRPISPYNNSQVAFITQTYQQRPYQTALPPPSVEQPPPSYYTVMNTATVAPSVSFMK